MTGIKPSDIVQSLAGRDKGRLFFVIKTEGDFAIVADGKLRKLSKPKRKRLRHLAFAAAGTSPVAERIARGESVSDSELRKALSPIRAEREKPKEGTRAWQKTM